MAEADELLFTYGSLQFAEVQLDTFGRVVVGEPDVLPGYTIDYVEIDDRRGAEVSGLSAHPVLRHTGDPRDKVMGRLLHLTSDELDAADDDEVSMYRRISVPLASGRTAWVYVT